MITTLLDKEVHLGDSKGKICAVYVDRGALYVGVLFDTGSITTTLASSVFLVHTVNNVKYYVVVKWEGNEKIKAIKTVRQITNMDLRTAKEFVEVTPYIINFENKSLDEATTIMELARSNNLIANIYKHNENT